MERQLNLQSCAQQIWAKENFPPCGQHMPSNFSMRDLNDGRWFGSAAQHCSISILTCWNKKNKCDYILALKISPKDNLHMRLPPVDSFWDKAVAFSSPKAQEVQPASSKFVVPEFQEISVGIRRRLESLIKRELPANQYLWGALPGVTVSQDLI